MDKGKEQQYETYYNDHINTTRSFLIAKDLPSTSIPLTEIVRNFLQSTSRHKSGLPDDMLILEYYISALNLINLFGYHIEIPQLFDRFISLSQSMRQIDLSDPDIQRYLRNEKP